MGTIESHLLVVSNPGNGRFFESWLAGFRMLLNVITGKDQLEQLLHQPYTEDYQGGFIQLELDWEGRRAEHAYGLNVAAQLRGAGWRCHFYFPTFIPTRVIESLPRGSRAILDVPAYHHLLSLPLILEPSKMAIGQMSKAQWQDITDTLLSIRTLVNERLHDLKNKLVLSKESDWSAIEKIVLREWRTLNAYLPEKKEDLQEIQSAFLIKIKGRFDEVGTLANFQELLDGFTPEILALTPTDNNTNENKPFQRPAKWQAVILDDQAEVGTRIQSALSDFGVSSSATVCGKETLEKFKEDEGKNLIKIFISDIRLKKANSEIWQEKQGYDIIQYLFEHHPHPARFYAISAARKRLLALKRDFPVMVDADYKPDVLSALNLYCDRIRRAGDDLYFKERNRPKLSAWINPTRRFAQPLQAYYKIHIQSFDYEDAETSINDIALNYYKSVLKEKNKPEAIEFTGTIMEPSTSESGLEKFRYRTLVGRRVALALYYLGWAEKRILTVMQQSEKISNEKASIDMLFKTSLALSFQKDLPKPEDIAKNWFLRSNLLEEEILFLAKNKLSDFNLTQVRISSEDADELINIFGDIQFSMAKTYNNKSGNTKAINDIIEFDFESLRNSDLKTLQTWLSKIDSAISGLSEVKKIWRKELQESLEIIHHEELRKAIQKILAS